MRYHFVTTLGFGSAAHTHAGTYTPRPGETRIDAYRALVKAAEQDAAEYGMVGDHVTLFFSLEPNNLSAVAS